MDIDSIDITHHVSQPMVAIPKVLTDNPWMNVDVTPNNTNVICSNITQFQLDIQPTLRAISNPELALTHHHQLGTTEEKETLQLSRAEDSHTASPSTELLSVDDS